MATIAEMVTYQIAQTEADLTADASLGYANIKSNAVNRAKVDLYYGQAIPLETAMVELVKYYLADCAVCYIIDAAADWYKTQARMSDAKESATFTYYNKIDALERLRRRLLGRIAQTKETVRNAISGLTAGQVHSLPLAQAQSEARGKVTVDPFLMARYYYGDYLDLTAEDVEPLELSPTREGL